MLLVFVLALVFGFASALPAQIKAQHEASKTGDFMGDIKLTERQKLIHQMPKNARSKLFISDYKQSWPNSIVPVSFSNKLTKENQEKIRTALRSLEQQTCFRFPDKKPENKDYIKFEFDTTPNAPCWSRLGKTGGEQLISLVQGCVDDPIGTVTHEVMHALGCEHEHQRPDRDDYIFVEPSWADRFAYNKIPTKMDLKRFPYDKTSVMHYAGFEMYENGKMIKMLYDKETNKPVPRPKKLSDEDIRKLNELGNCSANTAKRQNTNQRKPKKATKKSHKRPHVLFNRN